MKDAGFERVFAQMADRSMGKMRTPWSQEEYLAHMIRGSAVEIASHMHKPVSTVQQMLIKLKSLGKVNFIRQDRIPIWYVVKPHGPRKGA